MPITLQRHTRPDVRPGMCYGRLDIDVATSFPVEAQAAVAEMRKPDRILTSPLLRCRKLAEFVASAWELSYAVDERLVEMDFGRWEGMSWDAIPRVELDVWAQDPLAASPHGGEAVHEVNTRVGSLLEDIRSADERVLLITHAGVIKSARYLTSGCQAGFDWGQTVDFGKYLELPL